MKIEITYPPKAARKLQRHDIIRYARWPFLLAALACPVVNIIVGGYAWSVIVLWSLWIIWSFTFSPTLIEVNRISLLVKLIANTSFLLILIDVTLVPGWAIEVVSIICFSGLIAAGILFSTDMGKQKHNMMPMLMLIFATFIASLTGIIVWRNFAERWALVVMGAIALLLLVAGAATLRSDFIREIKRRFHM